MPDKLVFGAASLGMAYGLPRVGAGANAALGESDVAAIVEHALELGIATFDTAPAYGESELRLGRVLGARGRVWTKVTGGDPAASLAASLARLGRARVELLQWHNWSAALARDDGWRAAWLRLRSDPRVAQLGATTYGATDAVAAVESGCFDVVQCEFHVLNQGVVRALAALPITIAVRSVFLQGALTDEGREVPPLPALRAGIARAREVARGYGLSRLALRAALDERAIDHVLVGIDRIEQLDAAVAIAAAEPLTAEQHAQIATLDLGGNPECDPRTW